MWQRCEFSGFICGFCGMEIAKDISSCISTIPYLSMLLKMLPAVWTGQSKKKIHTTPHTLWPWTFFGECPRQAKIFLFRQVFTSPAALCTLEQKFTNFTNGASAVDDKPGKRPWGRGG